jgi:hypothetical protein
MELRRVRHGMIFESYLRDDKAWRCLMGWMRKVWARCRWKRIEGAAVFNEESFAVHRMTVWGQLSTGQWVVKRPLTVPASGAALYVTFRVSNGRTQ